MKLKDERGSEWEFDVQIGNCDRKYGILIKKESNPMPDLEEGDWYLVQDGIYAFLWKGDERDKRCGRVSAITEIRKSNGTVWKRDGV